jgi:hypothetical protein
MAVKHRDWIVPRYGVLRGFSSIRLQSRCHLSYYLEFQKTVALTYWVMFQPGSFTAFSHGWSKDLITWSSPVLFISVGKVSQNISSNQMTSTLPDQCFLTLHTIPCFVLPVPSTLPAIRWSPRPSPEPLFKPMLSISLSVFGFTTPVG